MPVLPSYLIDVWFLAALAATFTYFAVRRWFWPEHEARDAAKDLNKPMGWDLRQSDLESTLPFIRKSAKVYAGLALICWAGLVYVSATRVA